MPGQCLRKETLPGALWPHLLLTILLLGALPGCTDIRDYTGTWSGQIEQQVDLRQGLDEDTTITLTISQMDRSSLTGRVTITPGSGQVGAFTDAELVPVDKARNDVLGGLSFDGDPIGTYLAFIAPDDPAEDHALVLISAHTDKRLEVRVIRHDLYGVFKLSR